jgi:para-nitrobenzyl esterase
MSFVDVSLTSGSVRGLSAAGSARFLGIPYGSSVRFGAPSACAPWTGVRDALSFGPSAPQLHPFGADLGPVSERLLSMLYPRGGSPVEGGAVSEDCLYLNVWAPSALSGVGSLSGGASLPVMVWLHGGAFIHGSGNEMAFNGDVLAAAEGVVVVTVTHRLGLLGFLPVPGADGSGVAGLLDIVLALEWVRDNIAAFGGDPGNVTLFGQSGGAMKAGALLAMPAARGLFHKVIMQSGPPLRVLEPDAAAAVYADVHAAVGDVRDAPVARLLDAQAALAARMVPDIRQAMAIGPVRDPVHLPGQLFADGAPSYGSDVPLLIGTATHDMAMMLCGFPGYADADDAIVAGFLDQLSGGSGGADVVALYQSAYPAEPVPLLWSRIATDSSFRGGSYEVADAKAAQPAPVYTYIFDWPTDALGGILGACHSLDLPFVFGTTRRIPLAGQAPGTEEFSALIMRTWATFARTGTPTHDALPPWPAWSAWPAWSVAPLPDGPASAGGAASSGRVAMLLGRDPAPVDALSAAPLAATSSVSLPGSRPVRK